MKRQMLISLLIVMLILSLTACGRDGEEQKTQLPDAPSPSMPTLEVPSATIPTRPDKPVQKPETAQITEYIPLGGTVEVPVPVKGPWGSEQPFEPEDFGGYYVVDPEKKQIGGELEVVHVFSSSERADQTQVIYEFRGIKNIGTDPVMYRQGSHYDAYALKDGAFRQLEEHSLVGDYTVLGESVHLEFDWAEHDGEFTTTYEPAETRHFWKQYFPDGYVLMGFDLESRTDENGQQVPVWYYALLNLRTGELTDLLAGTEAEGQYHFRDAWMTEDRSGMLLGKFRQEVGHYVLDGFYYLDLTDGKLWSIEKLSGEAAEGCVLLEDRLTCWVLDETNRHRVWSIDLNTMERTGTISEGRYLHALRSDAACLNGRSGSGSRFALQLNDRQDGVALDLYSGERWLIPGLDRSAIPEDCMWLSPDGSKMLFYRKESRERPVIEYLAVLDMERHVFFEFERENDYCSFEYQGEHVMWRTGDSFVVSGGLKDGSGGYDHIYTLTG